VLTTFPVSLRSGTITTEPRCDIGVARDSAGVQVHPQGKNTKPVCSVCGLNILLLHALRNALQYAIYRRKNSKSFRGELNPIARSRPCSRAKSHNNARPMSPNPRSANPDCAYSLQHFVRQGISGRGGIGGEGEGGRTSKGKYPDPVSAGVFHSV